MSGEPVWVSRHPVHRFKCNFVLFTLYVFLLLACPMSDVGLWACLGGYRRPMANNRSLGHVRVEKIIQLKITL